MEVTSVRVNKVKEGNTNSKLLGFASIVIDDAIAIHNIRLIDNDGKRFLSFPCVKSAQGKISDIVHPINTETRTNIEKLVFDEFDKAE